MAKPRKRHIQQPLFRPRGGKRTGAGRPPKGPRSSEPHKTRAAFKPSEPLHVIARVEPTVGCLRKRHIYRAIREATLCAGQSERFHIIHLSIQSNHLHLIVEAQNRTALAKGMQGFQISAAKHINHEISKKRGTRRRGRVFTDRYHARILKSPRSVRNALNYVLNNWRHHDEDKASIAKDWKVDPFSTAVWFPGWKERAHKLFFWKPPTTYESMWVWFPKTWLLREGWQRAGSISLHAVPG